MVGGDHPQALGQGIEAGMGRVWGAGIGVSVQINTARSIRGRTILKKKASRLPHSKPLPTRCNHVAPCQTTAPVRTGKGTKVASQGV